MENDFDPDWPHGHVVGGCPARIICTDKAGDCPIVALVMLDRVEHTYFFSRDGFSTGGVKIYNAPAPKKRITGWLNIYPNLVSSYLRETRHDADRYSDPSRIACIYIDFEEGEGL